MASSAFFASSSSTASAASANRPPSNLARPATGPSPPTHDPQPAAVGAGEGPSGAGPSSSSSSSPSSSSSFSAGANVLVSAQTAVSPPRSPAPPVLSSTANSRWGAFASPPLQFQQTAADEAAARVAAAQAAPNSFYPAAYPDSPARRTHIGPSANAATGGTRLARLEETTSLYGAAPAYIDHQHHSIGPSTGVGVIGPTAASPLIRGGPKHSLSSPTLGLGSPHNSLSAILGHGDSHDDDEHDWEKDINRQNALGVGDDSTENTALPTHLHRSHHAHSQSQSAASFADWSPPSTSPVLSGSRSTHFPPGAASGGHSRSGSNAASGSTLDRSLGPPGQQSLHRLISPFHRDQQASLSQLLLGPPGAAADSRSPGSSSSASASDYFVSASNNNSNDMPLFAAADSTAHSKIVRRHQSLNHHIGRHLAAGRGANAGTALGSGRGGQVPGAGLGSSSTVGRSAAAAALRANADPHYPTTSNQSPPLPAHNAAHTSHSPSMRSPTSPGGYASSRFRDRTILERDQSSGSPPLAPGNAETFSTTLRDNLSDPPLSARTNRGRGLSDAPNNLMTIHAHLQSLNLQASSPSPTYGIPAPLRLGQPLRRDESVDSAITATVRTPTGLMYAPHLASGTASPNSGSGSGSAGLEWSGRAARQSASEGMDPLPSSNGAGRSSNQAAEELSGSVNMGDAQHGGTKTRKLPSLITNRDALVRGAMGSGPSVASAAPAGFGYTRASVSTRPGPGQHGPIGPATAGPVPATYYESERGLTQSSWGGLESPTPLSAGAVEDEDEPQYQQQTHDGPQALRTSSLRQNTFDGATIGSSASVGAKNGSRFDIFRGIKTAAPVPTWRQKEIIAGGRDEVAEEAGRTDAPGDETVRADQGGEATGDEGAHTGGLGRASSLHQTHHPGARSKDMTAGHPKLPGTPGESRTYGARASALQSQWGIALSPVTSAPHHDLYEILARDGAGGRPTRSGSMRLPGPKSRFDDGGSGRLDQSSSGFTPPMGTSSDGNSPFPGFADPTGSLSNNGTTAPTSPTNAALLEQANQDTMRLSMALAEQQHKTAFLRAQMSMMGPGMATPGNGVPVLGMPYPPPPGVGMAGNGMGLGMGVGMGMGMGMGMGFGMGMGPPGPVMMPGLGAQIPGLYPDQVDMGAAGMLGRPGMVNGLQPDLGGMGASGSGGGFMPDGSAAGRLPGGPPFLPGGPTPGMGPDASVNANGLNKSGPAGLNNLPPLPMATTDSTAGNGGGGGGGGGPPGTVPSTMSPPSTALMAQMIAAKGYNPPSFPMRPHNARYFVIKSFTEDDVYKCLKYEIWASTDKGNQRLDRAFRENSRGPGDAPDGNGHGSGKATGPGPIFLFFSVNASGHFCGMAQMLSPVDYNTSSNVWAQDGKWKGTFNVRWIFVKDLPNGQLRHIRLTNTPEVKSVTQSRDTQELPREAGEEVLRILAEYQARTSLLQDMSFYEMQDKRHVYQPSAGNLGAPIPGSLLPSTVGHVPSQQQQHQQSQHQQQQQHPSQAQVPPAGQTSSPNPRRRQQPQVSNQPGGGAYQQQQPQHHHHHYGPGAGSIYPTGMNQRATHQEQPASAS
ncbi:unnamed protein product [Tilletia laevis]|uniref:Uncharacterized protein n=2 Tax=Tilletia TaxID=13289 RepID=A0A9N8QG41_9BASI|nr:hypothetical protein CF336_g3384 [Tilletia laevis]KAE8204757.1 hypothetical protein CF335_g2539 [Tilletia laevis]CAD6907824.1 unnamed protein product [Tilletia laevis]CAD6940208.1 unnamed protein product [Tilletia laevis]